MEKPPLNPLGLPLLQRVLGGCERTQTGAGRGEAPLLAFVLAAPIPEVDKLAPGCSTNVGHSLLSGQGWVLAGAIICRLRAGSTPTVAVCSHPFGQQGEKKLSWVGLGQVRGVLPAILGHPGQQSVHSALGHTHSLH